MKLDVSVIIPAYNEVKIIASAIKSVHSSGFSGSYEVIVVCNGCTDKTAERARSMGAKVFELPEKGAPEALNFGAQQANATTLAFLDADTTVSKNLLTDVVRARKEGYVGGRTVVKWSGNSLPAKVSWIVSYVHKYKWGGFCFLDKVVFNEIGGYKTGAKYGFDFDLARRASKGRPVAFLKSSSVLTSGRRYEKEGWWRHLWLSIKRYYIDEVLFRKGLKNETQIDYDDHR